MRKPWQRRTKPTAGYKSESSVAFEAFKIYRDLGPGRSHPRVAELLGKHVSLISGWSRRHSWIARAAEFDAEQDRLEQLEKAESRRIEITAARRARMTFWRAAELAGANLLGRLESGELIPTPRDAKNIVDSAIALSGVDDPGELQRQRSNKTVRELIDAAASAVSGILGEAELEAESEDDE